MRPDTADLVANPIRRDGLSEGIGRIVAEGLAARSEAEAAATCVVIAKELMRAATGFIFELDPGDVSEGWERAVVEGRSVVADRLDQPVAGRALSSFLGVPLRLGDQSVSVLGLGDKPGGFGHEDLKAAEALGPVITQVLSRKQSEARQAHQLSELQHRARNILSMVRSVIRRSAETALSAEEMGQALEGRLDAMARTQALLIGGGTEGVDLELMVRDELLAQAADERRVEVEGPPLELSPRAAEVLTLAIHELASNAARYGALGGQGRLRVSWAVLPRQNGEDWLTVRWRESGVAIISSGARRSGFGAEVIEQRLPYELGGEGRLRFEPGAVEAEFAFPLKAGDRLLAWTASDAERGLADGPLA